jgi:hypothetical protein
LPTPEVADNFKGYVLRLTAIAPNCNRAKKFHNPDIALALNGNITRGENPSSEFVHG